MKKILFSILLICFCIPAFSGALSSAINEAEESGCKDLKGKIEDLNNQLIALENEYEEKCVIDGTSDEVVEEEETGDLKCDDGTEPDENGCCTGETYTNMGRQGYNCCKSENECFPPLKEVKSVVERSDAKPQRRKSSGSRIRQ